MSGYSLSAARCVSRTAPSCQITRAATMTVVRLQTCEHGFVNLGVQNPFGDRMKTMIEREAC